jgi:type III secretion protein HrpB1
MNAAKPDYLDCPPDVVAGLVQTVSAALLSNFPKVIADPYDVELLVDALRVLRPQLGELEIFDALRNMLHARWEEAIHILTRMHQTAPHLTYGNALLAFCMVAVGRSEWRQVASQALADTPSQESRELIEAMQARDDLLSALRKVQTGGRFTLPASCERYAFPQRQGALTDEPAIDATVAVAAVPQPAPDLSYLRV